MARCLNSGAIEGSREAARGGRCGFCGFAFDTTPRLDRRVAGEVVPGWTVRIPSHPECVVSDGTPAKGVR